MNEQLAALFAILAALWTAQNAMLSTAKQLNEIRNAVLTGTLEGKGQLEPEYRRLFMADYKGGAMIAMVLGILFALGIALAPFLNAKGKLSFYLLVGYAVVTALIGIGFAVGSGISARHDTAIMEKAIKKAAEKAQSDKAEKAQSDKDLAGPTEAAGQLAHRPTDVEI
jgi:hypothetical protein